jgi:nitroreductase
VQNIMLAARGEGLETCPQAAFAQYHRVIRRHLPITPEEMVVCAMALGEADWDAPENSLVTERAPVGEWASFHGW